jgi:hypothetical protein
MRVRRRTVCAAAVVSLLVLSLLVFALRSPVLVVSDPSFAALYGEGRIKRQRFLLSAALFRRVKSVFIADEAGADMIPFAVEQAAKRPYCVLFPRRFAEGARRCRELFPEIPMILLENRYGGGEGADSRQDTRDLFVYSTEKERDFYLAGRYAAVLDRGKQGRILVFYNNQMREAERNAFVRGLHDEGYEKPPDFYTVFSQTANFSDISCVVLAGSGADYLDKNLEFPVILFSWLDPAMTSRAVVLMFDDSPWAQALAAVRMAEKGEERGKIPSKLLFFSERIADNGILRKLKKTASGKINPGP